MRQCLARIGIWMVAVLVVVAAVMVVDGQPPPQPLQQQQLRIRHHRSRRQQQQQQGSSSSSRNSGNIILELLQASTGDRIAILTNDAVIAVSSAERNDLTIVARTVGDDDENNDETTVKFALTRLGNNNNNNDDDNKVYKKYEGRAPFALCGKVANNNNKSGGGVSYNACNDALLVVGSRYRLSATLATGVGSVTMNFRLVPTTTEQQQPNDNDETDAGGDNDDDDEATTFEYDLIDTSSSPQRVLYTNMPNNAQIDRSTYWADLGSDDDNDNATPLTVAVRPIRMNDNNAADGNLSLHFDNGRVEGRAPYSYCGDTAGGIYNGCLAAAGSSSTTTHTISFRVVLSSGGGNNNQVVGGKRSFSFTLVDSDDAGDDKEASAPQDETMPPETEDDDDEEPAEDENSIVPAGSWQLRSNLPITARHEACFVWVDDRGYLIGGRRSPPTDIYDRRTDRWSTGTPPPLDLHHIQCVVVTHEVWIVAAWTDSFPRETSVDNIYIYDTINDAWSTRPGLPVARRRGSAAVIYAAALQRIYVSHGSRGGHATTQNDNVVTTGYLDYYDLDQQVWVTDLPNAPHPRDHTGGAFLHNRYVCVAGGRNGGVVNWPAVLATDCFDTVTSRWTTATTTTANLPAPRSGSSYGTSCQGDYMLLAGGEMGDRVYDDVYAFDGTTWTTLPNTLRTARHGSSLAMDCDCDRILLASGSGGPRGGPELTSMEVLGDGTC